MLGNHDLAYIDEEFCVSRFDEERYKPLKEIFSNNSELFKGACKIGNILFTHAGASNEWYNSYLNLHPELSNDSIVQNINKAVNERGDILLSHSAYRSGDNKYYSPVWLDYEELKDSAVHTISSYYQIFGHTMMPKNGQIEKGYNWACIDSRVVFEVDAYNPKQTLKVFEDK